MTNRLKLWLNLALMTMYYVGIMAGLLYLYGEGDFSTPPFIYQGF